MNFTRILALSLFGLTGTTAITWAEDIVLATSVNENRTEEIESYVSMATIKKAPTYHPLTQENPPLGVKQAVEIGLKFAKKKSGKAEKRELIQITMHSLYAYNSKLNDYKFWYYCVRFTSDSDPFEDVYVLMDGSVAKERVIKLKPDKSKN